MAADSPTILATSGGYREGGRVRIEFNDLVHHAVELSGATGRALRPDMYQAAQVAGFDLTDLTLFPMPNLVDIEGHLLAQDVVWVHVGSVANLLAVWRVHGLDQIFRRVWQAGVVLAGISAGSICW